MDVHGSFAHGASPSTQPVFVLTNVVEYGLNPDGTGPPLGIATGAPAVPPELRDTLVDGGTSVGGPTGAAADEAGAGGGAGGELCLPCEDELHPATTTTAVTATAIRLDLARNVFIYT
jgi:hypothetical protein